MLRSRIAKGVGVVAGCQKWRFVRLTLGEAKIEDMVAGRGLSWLLPHAADCFSAAQEASHDIRACETRSLTRSDTVINIHRPFTSHSSVHEVLLYGLIYEGGCFLLLAMHLTTATCRDEF